MYGMATSREVKSTESDSNKPTIPTMPSVIARPCQKVRETAPQIRLSARSITAKTQEPAQNTSTTHVTIAPTLSSENCPIVSRKNLLDRKSTRLHSSATD